MSFANLTTAGSISLPPHCGSSLKPQRANCVNGVGLIPVRSLLDPSHAFLLLFQAYLLNRMGRWLCWGTNIDGWPVLLQYSF